MTTDFSSFRITELSREHLPQLNRWRNDPEVVRWLGGNFLYIAGEVDEAWYEDYMKNRQSQVRLAIIAIDTDSYIGNVQLTHIHSINRSAEFAILIGDTRYRGAGAGSYAMREILRHGFHDLNLNRIWLSVLDDNAAAIRLYEKYGLKHEGRERQAVYKDGAYRDLLRMAILREDFKG